MKNLQMLMMEAVAIGILVVFIGYIIIYIMKSIKLNISKDKQMVLGLFILGATIHLFCEFTGVNKWYCKNGRACITN